MKKVLFGVLLLSFVASITITSCGTKARPACKKNAKKIKKMRKEGRIGV